MSFVTKLKVGFALLFIGFVVLDIKTADRRNKKISERIYNFLNETALNHVVISKEQNRSNHHLKELFIRNINTDSMIRLSPDDFTDKNIYDIVEVNDTIRKEKYGRKVFIYKRNKIDTLYFPPIKSIE